MRTSEVPLGHSRGSPRGISSPNLTGGPWREQRGSGRKTAVFLLVILALVLGGGGAAPTPPRRASPRGPRVPPPGPRAPPPGPRAPGTREESPRGWCLSSVSRPIAPSHRQGPGGRRPEAGPPPPLPRGASVRPVLPLFVLFVLLLVGALGAEPLHLFGGRGHDPDAGPVVPVVTVVTADHGAPVIWLVAPGADPDLVPPLISNHVSADGLRYHAPDRRFGTCSSGDGRRWSRHQSRGRGGLCQEWQRHRGRGDVHGNGGWGWCRRWRLGSVQRGRGLSLGGWNNFADDTVNKREKRKSQLSQAKYLKILPQKSLCSSSSRILYWKVQGWDRSQGSRPFTNLLLNLLSRGREIR